MRLAAEVYEAAVVPRDPQRPRRSRGWLARLGTRRRRAAQHLESPPPVVADIVVIDLRNGAERVEISVTGAEVTTVLARVHEDLDTMSVETFDEAWGLL